VAKHPYFKFIILFILFIIFIAGCAEEYKKYSIEMQPCDEAVERKLILSGNFSNQELERIAGLYERQLEHTTFCGKFIGNLPNDVGGAGFYACFLTNMGKTTIYSERFRGKDDLNEKIEDMKLKVDQGIDFLIGWLEYELGDDPNFDNLKVFCDKNLRQDCKNIIYYLWLANTVEEYKSSAEEEFGMRAMHYLLERDYFSLQEIPLIIQRLEDNPEEEVFRLASRFVADKMGYSDSKIAAKHLAFLSDNEHMEESMEKYMPTTDLYKQLWEKKKRQEDDPNAEPPDINDFMAEMVGFEFDLFPPTVEVKLACESEPFYTNGDWDEEGSQVVWSAGIAGNSELPTFFYNVCSDPNKQFQQEHFGRVVLGGEDLAQYCLWRKSLDEEKGKEWDTFLLSLNPTQDLEERVGSFQFSDYEQKRKEGNVRESDLPEKPRALILAGLKEKKQASGSLNEQLTEQEKQNR
jgi:hypothetical protein